MAEFYKQSFHHRLQLADKKVFDKDPDGNYFQVVTPWDNVNNEVK